MDSRVWIVPRHLLISCVCVFYVSFVFSLSSVSFLSFSSSFSFLQSPIHPEKKTCRLFLEKKCRFLVLRPWSPGSLHTPDHVETGCYLLTIMTCLVNDPIRQISKLPRNHLVQQLELLSSISSLLLLHLDWLISVEVVVGSLISIFSF